MEEEPFAQYEWIDTFGKNFIAVRNYVNEIHNIVRVAGGESMGQGASQPTMKVTETSKRGKKAEEIRLKPDGSMLTNILDDDEVRKLIHNMMALYEGTTIMNIVVECQKEFQEKYFSMMPNEWRHLVRDYVRMVTERPELQENEVFRFSMTG